MDPIAKVDTERMTQLERLVERTLSEFDLASLWNVRTDLDTVGQAKILALQLGKHGGIKGLQRAHEIESELRAVGEEPWR
jgi:hypothetical protein